MKQKRQFKARKHPPRHPIISHHEWQYLIAELLEEYPDALIAYQEPLAGLAGTGVGTIGFAWWRDLLGRTMCLMRHINADHAEVKQSLGEQDG